MKQDKFLTGILIGIGVLILLALGCSLPGRINAIIWQELHPEGVVHNYVLAVLNKDYQKAYGYLADLENKPTYEEFRQSFFNGMVNPSDVGVDVGRWKSIRMKRLWLCLFTIPIATRSPAVMPAKTVLCWWNRTASGS